jgi:TetR/AcrR family transcriptional regulator, cholesterol catabolism regulator
MSVREPRLGRRERKKLEVERRIREAALALFREKGYEATTVDEIAERADVAKGTFFNYFARKDSLLEALADDQVGELLEALGPEGTWPGSARDQLLRLFLGLGGLCARDPALSKVMMIENMRSFWLRTEADPLEEEFHELVSRVLANGVERGEMDANTDVMLGMKLLEAAYVTTMIDWLRSGAPGRGFDRELTAKFDIIFRGLGMGSANARGR